MSTVEERLDALEATVAKIKAKVESGAPPVTGRTSPDFLQRFSGIFANDPTFDEAVRLGQEWRHADRPAGQDAPETNG